MELERSYQTKHKKVYEEVDSQKNRVSKNNEAAVKKQIQNTDVNSVEKKMNNERTDKTRSGESIIKHRNGYEISGKLEDRKVFVRPCHGATIRCLEDHVKAVLRENPNKITFHIGVNNLPSGKGNKVIAEAIINLTIMLISRGF